VDSIINNHETPPSTPFDEALPHLPESLFHRVTRGNGRESRDSVEQSHKRQRRSPFGNSSWCDSPPCRTPRIHHSVPLGYGMA